MDVSSQILRAGTSAGANYEEADDGLIKESDELVRIMATVIRNADRGNED